MTTRPRLTPSGRCFTPAALAALLTLTAPAAAADTWAILLPRTTGTATSTAEIFRDLLQTELSSRVEGSFLAPEAACSDTACGRQVGSDVGADIVVFGALSRLGSKTIATVSVVDAQTGQILTSHRMSVGSIEELDTVAVRMAKAIAEGKTVENTAELGKITEREAKADTRREGDHAFGLRVGGIAPLDESHGDVPFGMYVDLAYWFEARWFAIEPRISFQFDTRSDDQRNFVAIPIDLGAYFIGGLSDIAPFVGGGVGMHWIYDRRPKTKVVGTFISTTHEADESDTGFGFGMFARAGLLLFRTYAVRMTISVDYNVTFATVNDFATPQSVSFGAGVLF